MLLVWIRLLEAGMPKWWQRSSLASSSDVLERIGVELVKRRLLHGEKNFQSRPES